MAQKVNYTCADANINDTCSAECTEYSFNRTIFTETIQMTWGLVCKNAYLADVSQTIFMFGILVGNIFFGTLADRFVSHQPSTSDDLICNFCLFSPLWETDLEDVVH